MNILLFKDHRISERKCPQPLYYIDTRSANEVETVDSKKRFVVSFNGSFCACVAQKHGRKLNASENLWWMFSSADWTPLANADFVCVYDREARRGNLCLGVEFVRRFWLSSWTRVNLASRNLSSKVFISFSIIVFLFFFF